jgi:hypothetical protein
VLGTNQTGSTDGRIMMSGPHSSDGELTRSQATYTVTSSLLGAGNIKTRTVGLTRGHDKTQLLSITRLTPVQTYKAGLHRYSTRGQYLSPDQLAHDPQFSSYATSIPA